uniref:G1/S-specific cyclin-D2 n=1 Tax=Aceria tosichella TaxID=561515 RepID=A0A6G1S672_9ACAR
MEDPVYLDDERVLNRMLASETRQEIESYFETCVQKDFTESDRHELAIWMRDVCIAEECQPDVLPLSILIIDRFLSVVRTKRNQLQLLGSVALLVASKLRQTIQIPAKHLIYYTQDLITLSELKTWELFVLTTLKWDLALITPVDYLDIFIRRMKLVDSQMISDIEDQAQKLIVECCLEFKYSLYPPSVIAWACLIKSMELWHLTSDHLHLTVKIQNHLARKITTTS